MGYNSLADNAVLFSFV